jgi:hypothetical protein
MLQTRTDTSAQPMMDLLLSILCDVSRGLSHLHSHNIIHAGKRAPVLVTCPCLEKHSSLPLRLAASCRALPFPFTTDVV